jgi:epoxyqueuosine reductase
VRGAAAWALGEIGGEAAADALGRALEAEQDPAVQDEIRRARSVIDPSMAEDASVDDT